MSTLRNAIQRRNHKERAQPLERGKWGLLEKHKDYALRAKDYNEKKTKLRALRAKAQARNPDEFYFGMLAAKNRGAAGSKTGTRHGDAGFAALSQDVVRLMKTQDLGYLRTTRNVARREVADLRRRLVLLRTHASARGAGRRVVYVESVAEQAERVRADGGEEVDEMDDEDAYDDDLAGLDDEDDEDDGDDEFSGFNDDNDEQTDNLDEEAQARQQLRQKAIQKLAAQLEAAEARLKALTEAEQGLELQRARMAKSPTVGGVTKHGLKFQVRQRKR